MGKVKWSESAEQDLNRIHAYYLQVSLRYADDIVQNLYATANRLSAFPKLGRKIPNGNEEDLRELIYRDYRIMYWVDMDTADSAGDEVEILNVFHTSRQFGGATDGE